MEEVQANDPLDQFAKARRSEADTCADGALSSSRVRAPQPQANMFGQRRDSAAARAAARAAKRAPPANELAMEQVQDPLEQRAKTPRPPAGTLADDGNGPELAPQQPSASAVTPHRRRQQAMVQLAVDEAAAAAAAVLRNGIRNGEGEIDSATVERIIAGFSVNVRQLLPLQSGSGAVPPPVGVPYAPVRGSVQGREDGLGRRMAQGKQAALTQVLQEFFEADYARRLCDQYNLQPIIGSAPTASIGLMFESLRLMDTTLVVRLVPVFEQRSEQLLDQLVKHLRVKKAVLPNLECLQYESKSPPLTRTIIL